MSTAGGVWRALERGNSIGCEIVQFFVKNNMQWFGKSLTPRDLEQYSRQLTEHPFHSVFGHAGYLINLAAPSSPKRDKSIESLIQEMQKAEALGLPFLVLHPGAHLGAGEQAGLQQVVSGLDEVIRVTRDSAVRIALENTAGRGTCLGYTSAHFAAIYDRVQHPRRLGICLDTAHFFAAGYDLRTPRGWNKAIAEIDASVGLNEVLAFHLNDSKADLGSRRDRHAGIGQGKLGRKAFAHIVNDSRFRDLPGCLETPKSPDMHEDLENLAILRSLVR
ncbi:MAG: deoxyribonuclease IV [Candidatus Omnitrophica bacterium]|nr:deoxyribonuclease IV [Candidatus Omnitrophota bacterium]